MSFNIENDRDNDRSTQESSSQDSRDEEYAEYYERKRQYELMRERMKIFDYEKYGYDIEGNNDIRTDASMPKPIASTSTLSESESHSAPPSMEFFEEVPQSRRKEAQRPSTRQNQSVLDKFLQGDLLRAGRMSFGEGRRNVDQQKANRRLFDDTGLPPNEPATKKLRSANEYLSEIGKETANVPADEEDDGMHLG